MLLSFITANWLPIIVVIVAILLVGLLVILWRNGYKKQVAQILFYLVTQAEQQFGGGTGELKFAAVSTWIYERLPWYIKLFFTTKQIDMMIEEAVTAMKGYLDENTKAKALVEGQLLTRYTSEMAPLNIGEEPPGGTE